MTLVRTRWDAEYRAQRYVDEPPVPFIERIVAMLRSPPVIADAPGLYVGCGNGRNFLPLVDAGLDLDGLDVSPEALRQLAERRPAIAPRRLCCDVHDVVRRRDYAYLIAIQVFQHGTSTEARRWFATAAALLPPGGLLFVRVNAVATQIYHRHTALEQTDSGGLTIRYDDGPKEGLAVHFYARAELDALTRDAFLQIDGLREDITHRDPPKTGSWVQWEGMWQRR